MRKNPNRFVILTALLAIVIALCAHYVVQSNEMDILKKSIPNIMQFYEAHADVLNSLVDISKRLEGEQEYWSVGWNAEKSLRVIGFPTYKWDEVTFFDQQEKEVIETAFSISYSDISINHYDSYGRIWVKTLNRHYAEIMFLPNEELRQYWIQDDCLVKYSEPIMDGWYVLIVDARPSIA